MAKRKYTSSAKANSVDTSPHSSPTTTASLYNALSPLQETPPTSPATPPPKRRRTSPPSHTVTKAELVEDCEAAPVLEDGESNAICLSKEPVQSQPAGCGAGTCELAYQHESTNPILDAEFGVATSNAGQGEVVYSLKIECQTKDQAAEAITYGEASLAGLPVELIRGILSFLPKSSLFDVRLLNAKFTRIARPYLFHNQHFRVPRHDMDEREVREAVGQAPFGLEYAEDVTFRSVATRQQPFSLSTNTASDQPHRTLDVLLSPFSPLSLKAISFLSETTTIPHVIVPAGHAFDTFKKVERISVPAYILRHWIEENTSSLPLLSHLGIYDVDGGEDLKAIAKSVGRAPEKLTSLNISFRPLVPGLQSSSLLYLQLFDRRERKHEELVQEMRNLLCFPRNEPIELPKLRHLKISNVCRPDALIEILFPGLIEMVALETLAVVDCPLSQELLRTLTTSELRHIELFRCSDQRMLSKFIGLCKNLDVLKVKMYESSPSHLLPAIKSHKSSLRELWLQGRFCGVYEPLLACKGRAEGPTYLLDLSTFSKLEQLAIPSPFAPEDLLLPPGMKAVMFLD